MSNSWTDYSQNRKIRELEESLGSTHARMASERSRMRSELSHIRGTLEQRLDRVSATLDAFIELSDVRATLSMFDDAAIARHRTLQMLDGASLSRLDLTDVPGYWLVPAARGLHALLSDDVGTARARFDEAARRDASRARHFAALAAALTRAEHARTMGEGVTADLLPHLPDPDEVVTRGQRALWLLTADGAFGDDARDHLILSTIRNWSNREVTVPPVRALAAAAPRSAPSVRPARRGRTGGGGTDAGRSAGHEGIAKRDAALRELTGLREAVARITALGGEETSTEALAPDEASAEFLSESLRTLVEEGSAEEAPLISRANTLRAVIESSGRQGALPLWTDEVGTVTALLGEDLTRQDAPPHRRTFALVLQRSAVVDSAESLLRAATEPVEDSSRVVVQGKQVTITSTGPDPRELARAEAGLGARHAYEGNARVYAWGFLALAGILALLGLVSSSGFWLLLCAASAVGSGSAFWVDHRERAAAREAGEAQVGRFSRSVAEAAEQWRDKLLASEQGTEQARGEAEEIRRLLNP
ncbi:hypothetical protein ACFWTE_09645 [Nocardiopsis sp. NPDC058631]|uniref:hypothetical protein n=1 Tax=Nocardiopsis sp. NPDC058631 TaxID=3346566 RepID=UPI003646E5EE